MTALFQCSTLELSCLHLPCLWADSNCLSCPVHASAACQTPAHSGDCQVRKCVIAFPQGAAAPRVGRIHTHKFSNSQGAFLEGFYPFSVPAQWLQLVWDCSTALQDGSERKSPGWVAKSPQPLLRTKESRVCLPTVTQLSVTCLSFTKPSPLSCLGLRYLKCHQEHLCPVGVYERGLSVILSCLSFNLWKH